MRSKNFDWLHYIIFVPRTNFFGRLWSISSHFSDLFFRATSRTCWERESKIISLFTTLKKNYRKPWTIHNITWFTVDLTHTVLPRFFQTQFSPLRLSMLHSLIFLYFYFESDFTLKYYNFIEMYFSKTKICFQQKSMIVSSKLWVLKLKCILCTLSSFFPSNFKCL